MRRGEARLAEPILRQAATRFPSDPKVHFNLAKVLFLLGRASEARAAYASAAARFPDYREGRGEQSSLPL